MFEEDWLGGSFTLDSDSFTLDSDKLDGMCLRKIDLEIVSHWTQTS